MDTFNPFDSNYNPQHESSFSEVSKEISTLKHERNLVLHEEAAKDRAVREIKGTLDLILADLNKVDEMSSKSNFTSANLKNKHTESSAKLLAMKAESRNIEMSKEQLLFQIDDYVNSFSTGLAHIVGDTLDNSDRTHQRVRNFGLAAIAGFANQGSEEEAIDARDMEQGIQSQMTQGN